MLETIDRKWKTSTTKAVIFPIVTARSLPKYISSWKCLHSHIETFLMDFNAIDLIEF